MSEGKKVMEACEACSRDHPETLPTGCKYGDIQRAKGDVDPSICPKLSELVTKDQRPLEKVSTSANLVSIDENTDIHRRETKSDRRYPLQVSISRKTDGKLLDPLDQKILDLLSVQHYERSIARITGYPRVTIQKRIRRLKQQGLIKHANESSARSYVKFYTLTAKGIKALIHDEGGTMNREQQACFTAHCSSFKFHILVSCQLSRVG